MCVVETREHVERSLADGPTRILLLDNESFSLSLFTCLSSFYLLVVNPRAPKNWQRLT